MFSRPAKLGILATSAYLLALLWAATLAPVQAQPSTAAQQANRYVILGGPCVLRAGSGTPEGSVTGVICDVYLRTNGAGGTTLYVKESGSGNTGWTAIASGAGTPHAFLSATHNDTTIAAAARGAIITGQGASPTWSRLTVGGSGNVLRSDGVDVAWSNDGQTLTINGSNITTGTVPAARLGSGTPDGTKFLRGDSVWSTGTTAAHNILSTTHSDAATASVVTGDLMAGVASAWNRLAIGGANAILHSNGTSPSWTQTPRIVRMGIGADADASGVLRIAGQYWSDEVAKGNSGTAMTIDWDDGVQQTVTLDNNVTFTFADGEAGARYSLILTQDGSGNRLVTWPASVNWVGAAPTLSTGAGVTDLCTFAFSNVASGTYFAACNIGY